MLTSNADFMKGDSMTRNELITHIETINDATVRKLFIQLLQESKEAARTFEHILTRREKAKDWRNAIRLFLSEQTNETSWDDIDTFFADLLPVVLEECAALFVEQEDWDEWHYYHGHDEEDTNRWDFTEGMALLEAFLQQLDELCEQGTWTVPIIGLLVLCKQLPNWFAEYENDDYDINELEEEISVEWLEDKIIMHVERIHKLTHEHTPQAQRAQAFLQRLTDWIMDSTWNPTQLNEKSHLVAACIVDRAHWESLQENLVRYLPLANSTSIPSGSPEQQLMEWWIKQALRFGQEQAAKQQLVRLQKPSASAQECLIAYYEQQKRLPEAISLLLKLLSKYEGNIYEHPQALPYYDKIIGLYEQDGCSEQAQQWRIKKLLVFPTQKAFEECCVHLSDAERPSQINALIQSLRDALFEAKYYSRLYEEVLGIMLYTGHIEQAWEELSRKYRSISSNTGRVPHISGVENDMLKQLEQQDPSRLLPLYWKLVEMRIELRNRSAYEEATRWLVRLRGIYLDLQQNEEWQQKIGALIYIQYPRLSALRDEIRKAGIALPAKVK